MRYRVRNIIMSVMVMTAALGLAVTPLWGEDPHLTDAGALFNYITQVDPYTDWHRWPGKDRMAKASGPYGARMTTYVNIKAYPPLRAGVGTLQPGAIIVGEDYTGNGELSSIRVMYKARGYNPEVGDWYFALYRPDGVVEDQGRVEVCMACHRPARNTGYLLTDHSPDYLALYNNVQSVLP